MLEIGTLHDSLDRQREAEDAFMLAADACRAALGREHPSCADAQVRAALTISHQTRLDEADLLFRQTEGAVRE